MKTEGGDSDEVIAELIGMGFEISDATEAVKATGPSLQEAVDFILNESGRKRKGVSSSIMKNAGCTKTLGRRPSSSLHSFGKLRQSSIRDILGSGGISKSSALSPKLDSSPKSVRCSRRTTSGGSSTLDQTQEVDDPKPYASPLVSNLNQTQEAAAEVLYHSRCDPAIGLDCEEKITSILHKRFGHLVLKEFQKEALAACLAYKDCLIIAATGSGKSLCFQIPALLTGKVVVVISPLISLMQDQCLKLAKHGVSACFLGSGQIDRSVEEKAMNGVYDIIYVCPETLLRLVVPLQNLAERRGIALFAIDEVHCVSKWGHDFRPDYRRLSVLREKFRTGTLKFLKFDIPLMALTATATVCVRDDILKSLCMSNETKMIVTSFFRPNLRFSVKQSRTSMSSYETDFRELTETYTKKRKSFERVEETSTYQENSPVNMSGIFGDNMLSQEETLRYDEFSDNDGEEDMSSECSSALSKDQKLSVEFLEDEADLLQDVDDLGVPYGEFYGRLPGRMDGVEASVTHLPQSRPEDRIFLQEQLEGPTIIYVPTRKETLSIAKFLTKCGVKAAAYNAKLPKSQLRQVHKEFQENALQVVVATVAFGMGIDKSNVRRIIHYGWPQSLEAYYQEAGRAGRDGKLADCVLYANLMRNPTLLPSKRSEEQTNVAYKMLSDCFRYVMRTSSCRAKSLVEYFGEEFRQEKCFLCDVCVKGPPAVQNLKTEVVLLLQAIAADSCDNSFQDVLYDGLPRDGGRQRRFLEKPNFRALVCSIREQHQEFASSELLWWRGLARILEDKGYIREGDDKIHLQIKFPELTKEGQELLKSAVEPFYVYPEADMLLSRINPRPYSSFSEWGKGWADPEIRRQRLERKKTSRNPKRRKYRKHEQDMKTARGRLTAKLSKKR